MEGLPKPTDRKTVQCIMLFVHLCCTISPFKPQIHFATSVRMVSLQFLMCFAIKIKIIYNQIRSKWQALMHD